MTNKIIGIIVLIAIGAGAYYFVNKDKQDEPDSNSQVAGYSQDEIKPNQEQQNVNNEQTTPPAADVKAPETAVATFDTSEGSFKITLDGKAAPKTVANFIKLSKEGFYNGLTFHRIVEGFMIQGGDPQGDGTGGPGYTIPAEIGLKHTKGAIAMARTGDEVNPKRDSSGSQFYITLDAQPFLDGQYTVFGYVTEGMNIVEKIGKTPTEPNPFTGEQSIPLKEIKINKITIQE